MIALDRATEKPEKTPRVVGGSIEAITEQILTGNGVGLRLFVPGRLWASGRHSSWRVSSPISRRESG